MSLSFYELLGDASMINEEVDKYLSITQKDVQRVAKFMFRKENSSVLNYKAKQK